MSTFGPAYDEKIDGKRIKKQHEVIRDFMLRHWNHWHTLGYLSLTLDYPEASISAQLRHLRKPKFGGYIVEKRRRAGSGTWEYRVRRPDPPKQEQRIQDRNANARKVAEDSDRLLQLLGRKPCTG